MVHPIFSSCQFRPHERSHFSEIKREQDIRYTRYNFHFLPDNVCEYQGRDASQFIKCPRQNSVLSDKWALNTFFSRFRTLSQFLAFDIGTVVDLGIVT